jgi:hypothetical protein
LSKPTARRGARNISAKLLATAMCFIPGVAVADELSGAGVSVRTSSPDILARDYVDIELHGGPAWRGNALDDRYSPVGYGLGMTFDIGKAPYWGGIYVHVGIFNSKEGIVDPANGEKPFVALSSAGYRGKLAIRLSHRLYFMPAVGVGVGVMDYASGACDRHAIQSKHDCHDIRHAGLGIQADATFVYAWRYGALTVQPLGMSTFLFERQLASTGVVATAGGDSLGLPRHGVWFGTFVGFSLDLSAMVLGIRDGIANVAKSIPGW